jgi:hypothetical protein
MLTPTRGIILIALGSFMFALGALLPSALNGADPAATAPTERQSHYISPPPRELWEPAPLPANVEMKAGCVVPKSARETTGPEASQRNQRVFEATDVVIYARADGTCVSLVRAQGSPPEFAPDVIIAVDDHAVEE